MLPKAIVRLLEGNLDESNAMGISPPFRHHRLLRRSAPRCVFASLSIGVRSAALPIRFRRPNMAARCPRRAPEGEPSSPWPGGPAQTVASCAVDRRCGNRKNILARVRQWGERKHGAFGNGAKCSWELKKAFPELFGEGLRCLFGLDQASASSVGASCGVAAAGKAKPA